MKGKQEVWWVAITTLQRSRGIQRGRFIMLHREGQRQEKTEGKFLPHLESLPVINSIQLVVSRS